jgi:hypothetical protein
MLYFKPRARRDQLVFTWVPLRYLDLSDFPCVQTTDCGIRASVRKDGFRDGALGGLKGSTSGVVFETE